MIYTPITPATDWSCPVENALEFTILVSAGKEKRYGLITKNEEGVYDTVTLYHSKEDKDPFVRIPKGKMVTGIVDDATKKNITKPCCRSYKLLELTPDGYYKQYALAFHFLA